MSLLYLDASVVVAAFVREATTKRVQSFLERRGAENLAVSSWVLTEFSSALALKMRTGGIDGHLFASAHARLQSFVSGVSRLPVVEPDFARAAAFCQRHDLALRAGDALHLAIASRTGCSLVTLDDRMAKAAPELGVLVAAL